MSGRVFGGCNLGVRLASQAEGATGALRCPGQPLAAGQSGRQCCQGRGGLL